ncbi:hypothetical protein FKR81_16390 [Lentzea tibetensis]|uniref:Uncharacterized protein n=1 Tax=Lentzea tibetensis TaxID=2591470 RepID=A0A563ETZ1_9PSEU|nr:hypothetical protein [Lentzea tibetensis]TWP51197.1 hypothetical protein FKR81_16390 [Lentzea tibetensis]
MGKTIAAMSDRLLGLFVPKVQARASAPCMQSGWCQHCGWEGTYEKRQWCYVNGSCTQIYCTTCLVNSPDC